MNEPKRKAPATPKAPAAPKTKNPVQEEGVKMENATPKATAPKKEMVVKVLKIAGTIAASFGAGLVLGLWAGKRNSSTTSEVVPFDLEE